MSSSSSPKANPLVVFTDRSRIIAYQECPRRRYLNNHLGGIGIQKTKLIIPLATGIYTHEALAHLLGGASVDSAVEVAVANYWAEVRARGIQIEPGEDGAQVAEEQCALVEAMSRAYAIRKLPELLEQFEVMETEREDVWPLSQMQDGTPVQMMSRLDALLRDKVDNSLYIQSFKTSAGYDRRQASEAEHDVQGLSEMAAVEYRLGQWWNAIQDIGDMSPAKDIMRERGCSERMFDYLAELPHPPQIAGIRMEYLIKGRRGEYPEGSGSYVQYSPLIRGLIKFGPTSESCEFGWKRDYVDDMGQKRKLDYRTWKAVPMWQQPGGIKAWIELLATGTVQPDAGDCLSSQFVTPVPYFRQDDDLRDWYEQTVVQETKVAEAVKIVADAQKEGPMTYRTALNTFFPQHRRSCDWPSSCQFVDVCYSTNVKEDPVGSGLFMPRVPHHEPEKKAAEGK